MADISKDTFDRTRRIRKLVHQQNRGLGDYELNELQDIQLAFQRDLQHSTGAVGPVGDGLLVEASASPNTLTVRPGLFLVDDTLFYLSSTETITGLTTPGAPRVDRVYAFIQRDEKNEVDFPDIINPVSGDVLALREAYDITFAVSEDHPTSPPVVPAGAQVLELAILNRTAVAVIDPSEVEDRRGLLSLTYHNGESSSATGRVTSPGALTVDVEAATGKVAGVDFSVGTTSTGVTDDATTYIYINQSGVRVLSTTRPLGWVAMEAVVVAVGGFISSITDARFFKARSQTGTLLSDLQDQVDPLEAEIVAARGVMPSLDDRLDTSLNEDGTLKPAAAFGGAIDRHEIDMLRPHEEAVPAMTVYVEAGQYSYGDSALEWGGGSSPTFTAPITDPRIDLLYLDQLGGLQIATGTEAVFPVAPTHDGLVVVAEITLSVGMTEIENADIRDVRPFFNLGGGGSGGSVTPLVGKTFVPQAPLHKLVHNAVYNNVAADFSIDIDFSAPVGVDTSAITIPASATHAVVKVSVLASSQGVGTDSIGYEAYAQAYTATPSTHNSLRTATIPLDEPTDTDNSDTGISYVELNDPVDPAGDLTIRIRAIVGALADGSELTVLVHVEGFYIDESVGAGTEVALQGKTFVPYDDGATKRLLSTTFAAVSTDQSSQLDLSALGVTVPDGATHVSLKVLTDVDLIAAGGGGSVAVTTYAGPYTATPSSLQTGDGRYFVNNANFNTGSEANAGDTGPTVFALNDPVDPTGDITLFYDVIVPGGGSVDVTIQVYLEGFWIEDSALVETTPLTGLTFVPQDAETKLVHRVSYSGLTADTSFTVDFSAPVGAGTTAIVPPVGATHAVVKVSMLMNASGVASDNLSVAALVQAYTGAPSTSAHLRAAIVDLNESTESNAADTGDKIVPLNVPAVPAGDLTVYLDMTLGAPIVDGVDLDVDVFIEGFYIEDVGSAQSPIHFSGRRAGAQTLANTTLASPDTLTFDDTESNVGGGFNETTGVFTAPVDGTYFFTASGSWDDVTNGGGGAAGPQILIDLFHNAAVVARTFNVPANDNAETDPTQHVNALLDLVAGDTVVCRAGHDTTAGARDITDTRFQGFLVTTSPSTITPTQTSNAGSVDLVAGPSGPTDIFSVTVPAGTKNIDIDLEAHVGAYPEIDALGSGSWTIDVEAFELTGSMIAGPGPGATPAGHAHNSENGLDLTGQVGTFQLIGLPGVFEVVLSAYTGVGALLTITVETLGTVGPAVARATVRWRNF